MNFTPLNKILKTISEVKQLIFNNGEGEVFLFGSRARGDESENSDWDLLILTPNKIDNQRDFDKYISPFIEIGWQLDEEIKPIHYSYEEWKSRDRTLFFHNVTRDAIKL